MTPEQRHEQNFQAVLHAHVNKYGLWQTVQVLMRVAKLKSAEEHPRQALHDYAWKEAHAALEDAELRLIRIGI